MTKHQQIWTEAGYFVEKITLHLYFWTFQGSGVIENVWITRTKSYAATTGM